MAGAICVVSVRGMMLGDLDEEIACEVWPAARAMLGWLHSVPEGTPPSLKGSIAPPALNGSTVLEVGAGTGFLAMELTKARGQGGHGVAKVYASDSNDQALAEMRLALSTSGSIARRVKPVWWDWTESLLPPQAVELEKLDWVVGTDIVYAGAHELELASALAALLRSGRVRKDLRALLLLCDRPAARVSGLRRRSSSSGGCSGGSDSCRQSKRRRIRTKRLGERDGGAANGPRACGPQERAVERFLRRCRGQGLSIQERCLSAQVLVESCGTSQLDGGDGSGGVLRLFELAATRGA